MFKSQQMILVHQITHKRNPAVLVTKWTRNI